MKRSEKMREARKQFWEDFNDYITFHGNLNNPEGFLEDRENYTYFRELHPIAGPIIKFIFWAITIALTLGILYAFGNWLGVFGSSEPEANKSAYEEIYEESDIVDYTLVRVSKSEYESMSEYDFVSTIKPILDANTDKSHTTFVFTNDDGTDDGTGLYFAFSDITKGGEYCEIDEKGNPTLWIGYITISGVSVTYEEAPESVSQASLDVYQYVPDKYIGDSLMLCDTDTILYVYLPLDVNTRGIAEDRANSFCTDLIANGYDCTNKVMYFNMGDLFGVIINPATSEIQSDDAADYEIINAVTSKIY